MPDVIAERRSAPRHAMVLAAEALELPRGTKLNARSADISLTGCTIDTLNPIPPGLKGPAPAHPWTRNLRDFGPCRPCELRLRDGDCFGSVEDEQLARLARWFSETGNEF